MKKRDLASLAMLGISAGLLFGGCQHSNQPQKAPQSNTEAAEQLSPDMQSFYNSLSPDAKRKFMDMDSKHRAMSMEMSDKGCKGPNNCSGNMDSTRAVNLQYQKQVQQRSQMNDNMRRH